MASSLARKAALPAGLSLSKAWAAMPPPLCGAAAEAPAPVVKPLPCEDSSASQGSAADLQQQFYRPKPEKSFKMHVGANLSIPTKNANERPIPQRVLTPQEQAGIDPFEGLPFRGLAEKMGGALMPALEQARAAERQAKVAARQAAEQAEVVVPPVPHVLPFTRWAANSQQFRSTFIADPPKQRKKARLSWYNPNDTMVPTGWFKMGLLEDLKYYSPFGYGSSGSGSQPSASA